MGAGMARTARVVMIPVGFIVLAEGRRTLSSEDGFVLG
jgi:precorrin isomerase